MNAGSHKTLIQMDGFRVETSQQKEEKQKKKKKKAVHPADGLSFAHCGYGK